MKGKLFSISLVLTFFILISTMASAGQDIKIGNGSEPAIDVGKVVWIDNGTIHVYDLTTKNETIISSSAASHPAISGNELVWRDESSGAPRLTVYDIKTRARSYITKDVDNSSIPAIYDSRIVWSANSSVYIRDISISTQIKIAAGNNPDIYDNRISYDSDSAGDTPQIYVYDLTTKKALDISQYGDNMFSHIYDDKVIWSDFYTRLGNIRMYNIATGQQTEVTTGDDMTGYDTGGPTDISGNKIVYLKHNNLANMDLGDLYVYDIDTGKSKQLTRGNTAQTPVISDNVIVWSDSGSIHMLNY
jgi:beta propeller repeat protein